MSGVQQGRSINACACVLVCYCAFVIATGAESWVLLCYSAIVALVDRSDGRYGAARTRCNRLGSNVVCLVCGDVQNARSRRAIVSLLRSAQQVGVGKRRGTEVRREISALPSISLLGQSKINCTHRPLKPADVCAQVVQQLAQRYSQCLPCSLQRRVTRVVQLQVAVAARTRKPYCRKISAGLRLCWSLYVRSLVLGTGPGGCQRSTEDDRVAWRGVRERGAKVKNRSEAFRSSRSACTRRVFTNRARQGVVAHRESVVRLEQQSCMAGGDERKHITRLHRAVSSPAGAERRLGCLSAEARAQGKASLLLRPMRQNATIHASETVARILPRHTSRKRLLLPCAYVHSSPCGCHQRHSQSFIRSPLG